MNFRLLKSITVLGGACLLSGLPARAETIHGQEYFTMGGGGAMLANGQPCPDLPCNGGDVCTCVQTSGNVGFSTTTKTFEPGTYTLEVSADKNTIMPNGVGGHCYGSGGYIVLTTKKGTLTLQFSGPACRLGVGDGAMEGVPYGISSPASIVSGTGIYTNPVGAGTLSATFDPPTSSALVNLVGYGILHR
jgi:hypothetical protein